MAELRVELLAFEGCPHLDRARRDLESVLRAGIVEVPIQVVLVGSEEDAEFLRFPGSPTIRINGDDVDPQPDLPIGIGCRVYRDAEGPLVGSPPIEKIRAAVDAHRRGRLEAFQQQEAGRVASFARDAAEAEAGPRPTTGGVEGDESGDRGTGEDAAVSGEGEAAPDRGTSEGVPDGTNSATDPRTEEFPG